MKDSWQTPRNARTLRAFMALRNQEIGERLRELRGQKPQTVVADELGVAERTYQNWEAGDAKPSYRNLQRLAEFYGVGEEFILTGEGTRIVSSTTGIEGRIRQLDTPDLFPASTDVALAEVLHAITEQLADQTKVLTEIKTVLVGAKEVLEDVKGMLGKDTETADRIEAASETVGAAAAQLDAQIRQVMATPISAPQRKPGAKRKTAQKRTPRA